MMLATADNLSAIAREARVARARGAFEIEFELEAKAGFARFVELWEGISGEVVGSIYEEPDEPPVPGIPRPRTVKYFRVRAPIASVLEAQRRRMESETRQFGN